MNDGFIEVRSLATGLKQRVPAHFLDDPIQSRHFAKTPQQRALDGELGQRPSPDAKIDELREYAEVAEVDITGLRSKADINAALDAAVGTDRLPEPGSDAGVAVEVPPAGQDVDAPVGEPGTTDLPPSGGEDTTPPQGDDDTPAAGDEEN